MPVTIRLTRVGRKKIACYRVVAADSRTKRDGRFLENLGTYNPQAKPKQFELKVDRIAYWLKSGAQPSETVLNLLKQDRVFEKIEALSKGLALETLNLARLPERKRKSKPKPEKKSS